MIRNESFHQRRTSKARRKESIASAKSDIASESESYYDSYIPIKKEALNTIIIEKKVFEKLLHYIQEENSFKEKIKNYKKEKKIPQLSKSMINFFTIKAVKPVNAIKTVIEENKNLVNAIKPKPVTELNKNKEEKKEENNNNKKSGENIINNIIINNNVKVNPKTSMLSLFMNSNREREKEKVKEKEKEEISQLKLVIAEMTKKYETEINNYKDIIKDLMKKVETLQIENKKLSEINEKMIQKANLNKQKIELVYSHPKILSIIISFLENHEKFNFSKCNSFLYKNLYFKAVCEKLSQKLQNKEKMIEKIEGEDLQTKFDIKDNEIQELFKKYIIDQKVSGIEMRNEIIKSLIFLETHVKIPLANFKGPMGEKGQEEPKKGQFFSKIFSAFKSEIKEEIGINQNSDMIINNNYISFKPEEYASIFDADRQVLETFKTDKSLNVKFEYNGSEKIKEIINDFFVCQLPQPSYKKFISKICETFSDLLYASFVALKDIKNLQIIVFALYGRYMRYKLKIEELQSVIEDLHHFAESSKQIKEMLTKNKNEFELKYTNSMMTISQLNSSIIQKDQEIYNINLKIKEKDEKYDKFKNEIIKEYKKIKDDFNFTQKERDALKGTLLELKDFFVKIVTGELLN